MPSKTFPSKIAEVGKRKKAKRKCYRLHPPCNYNYNKKMLVGRAEKFISNSYISLDDVRRWFHTIYIIASIDIWRPFNCSQHLINKLFFLQSFVDFSLPYFYSFPSKLFFVMYRFFLFLQNSLSFLFSGARRK